MVKLPTEKEIRLAAHEWATKMSNAPDKETPDWIETDFKAGVRWLTQFMFPISDIKPCDGCSRDCYNFQMGDCKNKSKS